MSEKLAEKREEIKNDQFELMRKSFDRLLDGTEAEPGLLKKVGAFGKIIKRKIVIFSHNPQIIR